MGEKKAPNTQRDFPRRSADQVIAAMLKPAWCEATEEGRLTWAMFCAAIRNDVDALKKHLTEDADRARLEFWYTPPIHFAVREGHLEATRVLWEAYPYNEVTKLIHLADDRGHSAVAEYLREQVGAGALEADLCLHEAVESGDRAEVDRLLAQDNTLTQQQDPAGRTPLHLAAICGQGDLVEVLLNAGAAIDTVDHQGFRPIHYAYWKNNLLVEPEPK